MICAAEMAESAKHREEQAFVEVYADWLECELENWTVTRNGAVLADVTEHYVRIYPVDPGRVRRFGGRCAGSAKEPATG